MTITIKMIVIYDIFASLRFVPLSSKNENDPSFFQITIIQKNDSFHGKNVWFHPSVIPRFDKHPKKSRLKQIFETQPSIYLYFIYFLFLFTLNNRTNQRTLSIIRLQNLCQHTAEPCFTLLNLNHDLLDCLRLSSRFY